MYLVDPKDGKQSITLTFLVVSFVLFAGFSGAEALGHAENAGSFAELFYACAALYFGRRVKVGSKAFSVSSEGQDSSNE